MERARYLERECAGDAALLARVVALLVSQECAQAYFELPLVPPPAPEGSRFEEQPGDAIGRYLLVENIGGGGCGVVWRAEQREPVRRSVALKVIKLGMDTREVIARFEGERQALALMDHPKQVEVDMEWSGWASQPA